MIKSEAIKSERKKLTAAIYGTKSATVRTVFILVLFSAPHLVDCLRRGGQGGQLVDDVAQTVSAPDIKLQPDSSQVQCEPIENSLCADMPYKNTRMPNFFGDTNQIDVAVRAQYYLRLASSKCSAHVRAYICELLTPVCLEQSREAMKRFDIYPCRSFCRRVQDDCEELIIHLNQVSNNTLLAGFACDKLPYESNGGLGTDSGPCHETPDQAGQQMSKTGYGPWKPSFDNNVPPFITDTSPLDPSLIKPPLSSNNNAVFEPEDVQTTRPNTLSQNVKHPSSGSQASDNSAPDRTKQQQQQQQQSGFFDQLYSFGHNFTLSLIRYSNAISIVIVLILLVALFSKRLGRLKCYLRLSPSSSTKSSSTNSTSSHHALHPNHHHQQRHSASSNRLQHTAPLGKQQHNQFQVSPSASSRSLMLIAGNNKKPPSHQLVEPASSGISPSQKLLFGMQHQRTLINANGTLERQYNNRYHQLVMQSAVRCKQSSASAKTFMSANDKQQLFNTLDSHSSQSNQYDYIQVASDRSTGSATKADYEQQQQQQQLIMRARQQQQQQQQQQLYSNILLSSPSHQVLLFDEPQQHQSVPTQSRSLLHQAQQLARQVNQIGPASNLSPYDSPTSLAASCPLGQEVRHQRSFQRRATNNNTNHSESGLVDTHQRVPIAFASPTRATYAASSASSCSASSSSSYSALSPASSSMAPPLPPQLVQPATRTNPRRPL